MKASLRTSDIVARARERCGGPAVPLRFLPDLARLTEAIDDEAALTGEGRARVRDSLISQLVIQIRTTNLLVTRPGISSARVPAPVFITGLHRTGTTLLQNLLAEHPAVRAPRLWELLAPASPAATPGARAALIDAARRYVAEYYRAAPAFRAIHPLAALRPEECHRLIGTTFRADIYALRYNVPRYAEWLRDQDMSDAYGYHRVLLSCLLARVPGEYVVLKCPFHLGHLDALARAYPGARVVRLHRDPAACIASVCSLTAAVRSARARAVDLAGIGRHWLGYATRTLSATPPRGLSVLDVRYADLLGGPIAVAARVCAFAGIPFTPAAERRMRAMLAAASSGAHAAHRYTLHDYGLDRAEIRDRFAAYNAAFDLLPARIRKEDTMAEVTNYEQVARGEIEEVNRHAGDNPIKVGILTPLTGPGDPVAGFLVARGARLGAEYVRENGGALGRQIAFVMRNDQASAYADGMQRSVVGELAKLAMTDKVTAVLGQWHLRTAPYAAELCEHIGVPMFVENGHSAVTASGYRTIFRTYFSIEDRVPLMLDLLAGQGLRRLAILAADTVFGLETADTLEAYGTATHGMEFVRFDFPQETTTDLTPQLRKIAEFEPDAIINDAVVRTNYLIINQAAELGLRPRIPMMVTFGFPMRSADFWREAGPAGNGILWPATCYRPSWPGLTGIGRWFTERYTDRYGSMPPDTCLSAFTDVTLVARAVAAAGTDDRAAVIEALEAEEFPTWRGPVRFVRGARHWHHSPPPLQIMQYQSVGQDFGDAVVVFPEAVADGPYRSPAELT